MRTISRNPLREDARILIVDDQEGNVRLLERVLARAGYRNVEGITDPRRVPDVVDRLRPDLILLDLLMPQMDGYAVLERLRSVLPRDSFLPVIVLTADATVDAKLRALTAGATDFLTKPFDVAEVELRVRNILHARYLHVQLEDHNRLLEDRVKERTEELEESYSQTLERLALAAEYRDDATGEHIQRVGRTSGLVAKELGYPPDHVKLIGQAAALHDVGKIGIPDAILLKPGNLTSEEFRVVKTHTEIGAKILSGSRSALLQLAEKIAWAHHERWDGAGYAGLFGDDIPLEARITTVADAFDAMTSDRPYRGALSQEEALAEMVRQRGGQFDPTVIDAFLTVQARTDLTASLEEPPGPRTRMASLL